MSNSRYHICYQKSKDKDAYLRHHETELILHDGAENMLKSFGINLKTLDIENIRNDYNTLCSKKQALQKTYKSAEKDIIVMKKELDNLNQYLNRIPEQQLIAEIRPENKQHSL